LTRKPPSPKPRSRAFATRGTSSSSKTRRVIIVSIEYPYRSLFCTGIRITLLAEYSILEYSC
jgi:hypothetical protein